jgi:hypothetical protein
MPFSMTISRLPEVRFSSEGRSLARGVLWLTALTFVGLGAASAFLPLFMAGMVEIGLPSATARVDFAATYGGFELGFGAFLLICLRRFWIEAGLWAGAVALTGFATVRLLTLVGSQASVRPVIYLALALEVLGVVLNVWALRASRGVLGRSV